MKCKLTTGGGCSVLGNSLKAFWISSFIYLILVFVALSNPYSEKVIAQETEVKQTSDNELEQETLPIEFTVSVAGDVTIGTDLDYGYNGSFIHEVKKNNYSYAHFVKYIKPIFEQDDLTIVNLETTLTNAQKKADKKFTFKGDPAFVQILKEGSIEVVNLSNNHIYDFLEKGFQDTVTTLKKADISYFGSGYKYITEIKGIRIGVLGYKGWDSSDNVKKQMKKEIQGMRGKTDLVIVSFHWGIERAKYPNETQKRLGHFSIEQGADLVFGHHPHVVQGIEKYKGKYIVYSLGNFMFGGNKNPSDKDTFVFQQTFQFNPKNKTIVDSQIKVIPFSISSEKTRNNYQPLLLEGKEKERVYNKIVHLSEIF